MAARRKRKRSAGRSNRSGIWTWILLSCALAVLAVGTTLYIRSRLAASAEKTAVVAPRSRAPQPTPAAPEPGRFEFYEMLPRSEVIISDIGDDEKPDTSPRPLDAPGVYVLQAGAYNSFAEADRVKAQLALLGISSQIQRIAVEDQQYHRVRIGPIEQLDELNRLRLRLREANIDAMLIRVGE
jgi:cell division protein FtsN